MSETALLHKSAGTHESCEKSLNYKYFMHPIIGFRVIVAFMCCFFDLCNNASETVLFLVDRIT
jgi:hypothetical protein